MRSIGYYERDEYWIKDKFGGKNKLKVVSPPTPTPSPSIRLSAEANHGKLPYSEETTQELKRDKKFNPKPAGMKFTACIRRTHV